MPTTHQRVSEYVLDQPIGSGTFGQVWRAHHHVWADQIVAIKFPTDPQYVRNLQHEGRAIHGLVHPNIVRAIGFDPFGDPPYLVMEYVPGMNLRTLIKDHRPDVAGSVAILRQVLTGLIYAHGRGIIHRDLKPENILIHERAFTEGFATEGVVKITDFGLGGAANKAAAGSIVYSASLNDPAGRELAGTLDYMAPEQRTAGAPLDGRADLYACGVILYELLTGERPAGTEMPSERVPGISPALDNVFRHSYARLEKRYATAEDFSKALAAALSPAVVQVKTSAARASAAPMRLAAAAYTRTSCHQCQQSVDARDQFCMHCGTQLSERVRRCGKCGGYPEASDRFCIFCGDALIDQVAAAGA